MDGLSILEFHHDSGTCGAWTHKDETIRAKLNYEGCQRHRPTLKEHERRRTCLSEMPKACCRPAIRALPMLLESWSWKYLCTVIYKRWR